MHLPGGFLPWAAMRKAEQECLSIQGVACFRGLSQQIMEPRGHRGGAGVSLEHLGPMFEGLEGTRRVQSSRGTISPPQNLYPSIVCCLVLLMLDVTNKTAQHIQNKTVDWPPLRRSSGRCVWGLGQKVLLETHILPWLKVVPLLPGRAIGLGLVADATLILRWVLS